MLNDIIQAFQVTFLGPATSLFVAAMATIMASEGEGGQGVEHTWIPSAEIHIHYGVICADFFWQRNWLSGILCALICGIYCCCGFAGNLRK